MTQANHPLTPVYFLSIGGPNFIEDNAHPAYATLSSIGREITQTVKPKAIVVFSAHWQADGPNKILVNAAENANLIYDFYGFPKHYYEYKYPNFGSPEIAGRVVDMLSTGMGGEVEVKKVDRGLDHGIWAGFMAAFNPKENPLDIPIVQVSLFGSEDVDKHYRMGRALRKLREEGILIIGAGMAVHNLRDYRTARGTGRDMPYTLTFDEALKDAATAKPKERQKRMGELMKRSDTRKAHPSLEHLLPMYVSAGAAGEEIGKRVWTLAEGSLGWAQYRFGVATVA